MKRAGWFARRFGTVAYFASLDKQLSFNIIVGPAYSAVTIEQNQRLFRRHYSNSILKEGIIIINGSEYFAGVYTKFGLLNKRFVIIQAGNEYAIACAALHSTLEEFESESEPVFDAIVSSVRFI